MLLAVSDGALLRALWCERYGNWSGYYDGVEAKPKSRQVGGQRHSYGDASRAELKPEAVAKKSAAIGYFLWLEKLSLVGLADVFL